MIPAARIFLPSRRIGRAGRHNRDTILDCVAATLVDRDAVNNVGNGVFVVRRNCTCNFDKPRSSANQFHLLVCLNRRSIMAGLRPNMARDKFAQLKRKSGGSE
ncbi:MULTISPECIES: hypothetical protein [Bradyrhizobium]|uniref:hypothetical protein n=1 Tax=Bradyrhizobium TaxID=374 RepID=UPI001B89DD77|nr:MULTISPECIES: hypothetical protein [Bradyrhizobium]MBR0974044.1 hypothetical protein [Bradyrhizobium japonicum]